MPRFHYYVVAEATEGDRYNGPFVLAGSDRLDAASFASEHFQHEFVSCSIMTRDAVERAGLTAHAELFDSDHEAWEKEGPVTAILPRRYYFYLFQMMDANYQGRPVKLLTGGDDFGQMRSIYHAMEGPGKVLRIYPRSEVNQNRGLRKMADEYDRRKERESAEHPRAVAAHLVDEADLRLMAGDLARAIWGEHVGILSTPLEGGGIQLEPWDDGIVAGVGGRNPSRPEHAVYGRGYTNESDPAYLASARLLDRMAREYLIYLESGLDAVSDPPGGQG